jgi:hypothetical protein
MDESQKPMQYLSSTHDGAAAVAEEALAAIVEAFGPAALPYLDGIEARLNDRYKNSGISPEHEMRHAELVKPVLDEITRLMSAARRRM